MALTSDNIVSLGSTRLLELTPSDINSGVSKCEISVAYDGKNRNGSFISHEQMLNLAKTLRGIPIVAAWDPQKQDFGDHGQEIVIKNGEITMNCLTVPYGFVAPNSKVWFQDVRELNKDGSVIDRCYLMTEGYVWTGQYPEITRAVTEGRPQSMELTNVEGHWAEIDNSGNEFFIIDDGTEISKLCVLGLDIPPCFEGAEITRPEISNNFNYDEWQQRVYSMTNELSLILKNEGGLNMEVSELEFEAIEEEVPETEFVETGAEESEASEEEEFAAKQDEDEEEPVEEDKEEPVEDEEEEDKKFEVEEVQSYSVEEYEALQSEIASLKAELETLRAFKLEREREAKDAVINKYHMLSDEDKQDVIANKDNYSLEEIDSKLALIYVQHNVDFDTINGEKEEVAETESVFTFSLEDESASEGVPAMVALLRKYKN